MYRIANIVFSLIVFLIVSIFCYNYFGRNAQTLYVGVDGYSAPFCITNDIGELRGYNIDLMNAIGKALDVKIEYRIIPFTALQESLRLGTVDLVIAPFDSSSRKNQQYTSYSDPYYRNVFAYAIKDRQPKFRFTNQGVKGKTICVVEKQHVLEYVRRNLYHARLAIYNSSQASFKGLFEGYCDAIVDAKSSLDYYVTKHKLRRVEVKPLIYKNSKPHVYRIAVKKGRTDLVDSINLGLKYVKQTGAFERINLKWFSSTQDLFEQD